jgi:hypothetical protein
LSGFFGYKTIEEYTEGVEQKDRMRARRKSSQGGSERGGFVGFLKRMAKKDEGGGHGERWWMMDGLNWHYRGSGKYYIMKGRW